MTRLLITFVSIATAAASITRADDTNLAERVSQLEAKLAAMEAKDEQTLRGSWKNGFVFEDPDKEFRLMLGGRAQIDTAFFDADEALDEDAGPFDDGVKARRVRMSMRGTMYDNLDFAIEYDFASGGSMQAAYLGVRNVPVAGNVRAGHQLEPMGLEELTSNNYITFMERGSVTFFNPDYNIGLMAFDASANQRMTWAYGVFKDTDSDGISISNETWALTARITGLPYLSSDEKSYAHLGASVSRRDFDDGNSYRIRARPGSAIAPYVISTGNLDADETLLTGLEAILTLESFSLQSEYMKSSVDLNSDPTDDASDPAFDTYYVMASYFLTGEFRPYSKKSGCPDRVTPKQNATGKQWGAGAWEVAARYDVVDLSDSGVDGGEMDSWSGGINWYLNPNARIMLDYTQADVQDTGKVNTTAMRFQVDF